MTRVWMTHGAIKERQATPFGDSEKLSRSVHIKAEKPQEEPKHLIYRQEKSDNRKILTWLN